MEDKQEKSVKELRAELVKLGFDAKAAEGIKTKEALVATIDSLSKKAKKVETINPPANPKEEQDTEKRWLAKADRMAKHLEAQEKVRVLIPLEPTEKTPGRVDVVKNSRGIVEYRYKGGAVWSKTFNGYKVNVPKGTYFSVPEQIAENIAEEYSQTLNAGKAFSLDRVDPETGRPVRDQL